MHGGTRRRTVLVSTLVTCALMLSGCFGDRDGDSVAADNADRVAGQLESDLGYPIGGWAEDIARDVIPKEHAGGDSVDPWTAHIGLLDWAGRTEADQQATIDVRIAVTVDEFVPAAIGYRGHSAGEATRCYRFVVRNVGEPIRRDIDCPAPSAGTRVPRAAPIPRMPDAARNLLEAALDAATPETVDAAVLAMFPEPYLFTDTATHNGTLVATVGVRGEPECLLLIKKPNGEIQAPEYDPSLLQAPGPGCSTGLFTTR